MNHRTIKGKICQRTEHFRFYDRKNIYSSPPTFDIYFYYTFTSKKFLCLGNLHKLICDP